MRKRVFLLDDHPLVREWLASLVAHEPDLEVCGQADDAPTAIAAVGANPPDIVVVDLSLPRGSGLDFIKYMKSAHPAVRLLVLSMHDEADVAERAFRAGAHGFTIKRESGPSIIGAIHQVLAGRFYASSSLTTRLAGRIFERDAERAANAPEDILSDRELHVFQLRGRGRTPKEIAHQLGVSVKTISAYEARIREKLGLSDIGELVRRAVLWDESHRRL